MGTLISKLLGTDNGRRPKRVVHFVSEREVAFSTDGSNERIIRVTRVVDVRSEMAAMDDTEALERELIGTTWATW